MLQTLIIDLKLRERTGQIFPIHIILKNQSFKSTYIGNQKKSEIEIEIQLAFES